jgi:hypothetical protein
VTGQVRRQPAPRPPLGQQWPPPLPHVAGRAEAVQQQQDGLPAATLVNPQASLHNPQCAIAQSPITARDLAPNEGTKAGTRDGKRRSGSDGLTRSAARQSVLALPAAGIAFPRKRYGRDCRGHCDLVSQLSAA